MNKLRKQVLIFGWLTLLIFPIPGFLMRYWLTDTHFLGFFEWQNLTIISVGFGLQLGFVYGILGYFLMQAPIFEKLPTRIERLIGEMKLKWYDGIFLSICAGFGEEFLFRAGLQFLTGPIIGAIIFVALHGYLNPWNWRFSLYGLIVLPFILLIAYGYEMFGIWFCVAAHFAYDAVLFRFMYEEEKNVQ
jgi:membrane protease YdiL (CAAX protease family)